MLPLFLIVILSLFVFYSIKFMIKRGHDLHAMAFFTLYIYTIFAQIGYAYYPELSILLGAYFGPELFYSYWAFMFFSFFFTFLLYKKISRSNSNKYYYRVKPTNRKSGLLIFLFISALLFLILYLYFRNNRGLFGWGGGSPMGSMWFVIGFRIFTMCTFFSYVFFRQKSNRLRLRRIVFLIFLAYFLFFLNVTIAAGVRSDILYFFIAVAFYELSPIINAVKYQKKKVLSFVAIGFFLINILMIILALRTQTGKVGFSSIVNFQSSDSRSPDVSLPAKILLQDYYSPSHPLFISMHYHLVDPIETIKSNFANSLILFKYPFLSQTIVSYVDSSTERGGGWAYHIFIEGYNAVGWLGIFYNAIFWNLGLGFWLLLSKSDNKAHNKAMSAILIFLIVNTMRSQTAAFIQSFWMILIPSLCLLLLSTNSKISILKKAKNV